MRTSKEDLEHWIRYAESQSYGTVMGQDAVLDSMFQWQAVADLAKILLEREVSDGSVE